MRQFSFSLSIMSSFILGLETSCDETAAAIVTDAGEGLARIRSSVVRTQLNHAEYGGVVPEIAARAHAELLFPIVKQALDEAELSFENLSAIAATCGPGLMGGVLVGAMAAKTLAWINEKPFLAINHLEGHAQVARLADSCITFPYLLLLVSGGHCQFLEVYGLGQYRLLGETLDDSAGEAFDKIARLIGLGYPGGPSIEKGAQEGDPSRFTVPLPLKGKPGCNLSFSGLKTAYRLLIQDLQSQSSLLEQDVCDLAASIQRSIAEVLVDRARHAFQAASEAVKANRTFVVAGGVAANRLIRQRLEELCTEFGFAFFAPPASLCTDNAVMIAWVGLGYAECGIQHDLAFAPCPRWPLEALGKS